MSEMTSQSRILKAAVIRAARDRKPISVTVEDLEFAKQYEELHGPLEISAILEGRCFTLGIASRWPEEDRIDAIGQNGNDGDHYGN